MFDEIFNCYFGIYKDLLDGFYPAKNHTGFTERNLSVNWVKAIERTRPNNRITSWFEYQFGEKNNEHIDALVWDRTQKDLFLVESKRYSNPKPKIMSVGSDIMRLKDMNLENDIIKYSTNDAVFQRIDPSEVKRCFGVILADIWPNGSPRKNCILEEYKSKTFLKDELGLLCADGRDTLKNYEFNNLSYYSYTLPNEYLAGYSLLCIIWQIADFI